MSALLDTQPFLWWLGDDPRLSPRAREMVSDAGQAIHVSAVSAWEIAVKAKLGRLRLSGYLPSFLTDQLSANGFRLLPLRLAHALEVYNLPAHHDDPFDRLLVAQCRVERLPLLSADPHFEPYDITLLW